MTESDALLRRVEHTAVLCCLAMAAVAFVAAHGDVRPALGVFGGGLLIAVSYWSMKGAVTALVATLAGQGSAAVRAPRAKTMVKVAGRYALLALLAYVMIGRLRMHPLALLAGASSFVAAVSVEAVRLLVKKPNLR